jgi:hypothetical protein
VSHLTPLRAIRRKCLDCCAGSAKEVRLCRARDCPLYGYRAGRNPRRAGVGGNPALTAEKS